MDQGLRPPSTQAFNCLIKVCLGFYVDYLLCDDYENEKRKEMLKVLFWNSFKHDVEKKHFFIFLFDYKNKCGFKV